METPTLPVTRQSMQWDTTKAPHPHSCGTTLMTRSLEEGFSAVLSNAAPHLRMIDEKN